MQVMDAGLADSELIDPERECGTCMGPVESRRGASGTVWVCTDGCGASWRILR